MERNLIINEISEYLCCNVETAELYIRLLEKPYTADEVTVDECEWSQGLLFLIENCLVSEYVDERNGGKKIYFSIDPQYSLPAILLNEAWKRESELHSLELLKYDKNNRELYEKYLLLENICNNLKEIYRRQLPYVKEIIVVARGQEKIASSIAEQISDTQHDIYAMVSPPQLMGEIVWQTVKEKMNSGVRYNRITDFEEIIRHGVEISKFEIESYNENLYIFLGTELPEKFYIFDSQSVAFFEKSKNKKKYLKKVQIIKNAGVASQFRSRYDLALKNSLDFKELIPKIYRFENELIQMANSVLDKRVVEWLLDVFNYGVFYSKGKYDKLFVEQAIEQCLKENMIRLLYDGSAVVNYNLNSLLK